MYFAERRHTGIGRRADLAVGNLTTEPSRLQPATTVGFASVGEQPISQRAKLLATVTLHDCASPVDREDAVRTRQPHFLFWGNSPEVVAGGPN